MLDVVRDNFSVLWSGFVQTVYLWLASMVGSTVLAVPLAYASLSDRAWLRRPVRVFSAVIRGIPPLVLMLFSFYGLPAAGVQIQPLPAAILALIVSQTAYYMECFRGGLMALPSGQVEAARALGLPAARTTARIVLPQVVRIIRPAYMAATTTLVKNTAIASVVSVPELLSSANDVINYRGHPFTVLLTAGIFYFVLNSVLLWFGRATNRELAAQ